MKILLILTTLFCVYSSFAATIVVMETSKGTMEIELNDEKAPLTVRNFLEYADTGFYAGTIFHRVIRTFVIQGGGHLPDMSMKETNPPIENEANNGLSNLRGTIAMARTNEIHSATSQFYINTVDNTRLDYQSPAKYGYAVFGKVISGLEVIDAIAGVETKSSGEYRDVPVEPIMILSVRRK